MKPALLRPPETTASSSTGPEEGFFSRPDPAVDLVGSIRWLMEHVAELERRGAEKRYSPSAAARELGYGQKYFYQPWRIPFFGLRGRRHSLRDFQDWIESRPEKERRVEWESLPLKQRRKARGAA